MEKYHEREKQLNQSLNEIELIDLYKSVDEHIGRIQILSRLKKILIHVPNQIQANPFYLKECNDRYFCFIMEQLSQNVKRDKPESMKFLFHVVSLRIKLWFNKKQFDDLFNSFMINIEHNKMAIPFVVEFMIELIDTFENNNSARNQSIQKKQLHNYDTDNNSRLSLTRKTNNLLFSDQMITRKTWRATQELNQALNKKCSYRKENRFQREFLDFELNKILIFANEVFNRAVVQNSKFDFQNDADDQEQMPFYIRMSIPNILQNLQLTHKILTFDFFGERKNIQTGEYFSQKMPLIIPTKYSKHCQFHQFQNWIKNKNDFFKYQYLYFSTSNSELKTIIVRIFGDLLRIHQKFFKKENFFKAHLENVLSPFKSLLENLEIKYSQDYDLAIAFGENITKLLSSFTFPAFLNLIRADLKKQFIEAIDQLIHKEILGQDLLDVTLIKYYLGFFTEILQKLSINSSQLFRVKDFQQDILISVNRIGEFYEECLYKLQNPKGLRKQFESYFSLWDAIDQVNIEYFREFFNFFKFYTPKLPYRDEMSINRKCINICAKVENCVWMYESFSKMKDIISSTEIRKKEIIRRHLLQCIARLIDLVERERPQSPQILNQETLLHFKIKLLAISYFGQKLLSSKHDILSEFDESNYIFKYTKLIITLVVQIKLFHYDRNLSKIDSQEVNSIYQFSLQMMTLALKINEDLLIKRTSKFQREKQLRNLNKKIKISKSQSQRQAKQIEEDLKRQCEQTLKQLNYYENHVSKIKRCFTEQIDKILNETTTMDEYVHLLVTSKTIHEKEFQEYLEPIYKLYFLSLQKYELHRKRHALFVAKQKSENPQKQSSIDGLDLQSSQVYSDDIENSPVKNDDECSVNEEFDPSQETSPLIGRPIHRCGQEIAKHDLSSDMNPIAYYVYLNMLDQLQGLKIQLSTDFKNQYNKLKLTRDLHLDNLMDQPKQTYNQIYSIHSIIEKLWKEYYQITGEISNPFTIELQHYLLRITSLLLKMFKNSRFDLDFRKEHLQIAIPFVTQQFTQIHNTNYKLESCSDTHFQEDRLMASRTQAIICILQTLVSVHFTEQMTNLYNIQFLILFPSTQAPLNTSISVLTPTIKQEIRHIFASTQNISRLFDSVLNMVINFPQAYLQNGFYPLIQTQLISLVREIYFEFSQFITIYLFGLSTGVDFNQAIELMDMAQVVTEQEEYLFEKYAVTLNSNNLNCVIWAYNMLLRYIQKVLLLSYHSQNAEWVKIRSKEILPFLKQIILFFKNLMKSKDFLVYAMKLEFLNENRESFIFLDVVRRFYDSIFEFLRYFLTNFEELEVSFITQHLSLIECIYQIVKIGREMEVEQVASYVERQVAILNSIIIFKSIPDPSTVKRSKSARTIKSKDPIWVRYRGFEYIQRLYTSDEQSILDQLETYEVKFKYYIARQCRQEQTQSMRQTSQQNQSSAASQLREIQINTKKSKQVLQSLKKSPCKHFEYDWSDIEDAYNDDSSLENQFKKETQAEEVEYQKQKFMLSKKRERSIESNSVNKNAQKEHTLDEIKQIEDGLKYENELKMEIQQEIHRKEDKKQHREEDQARKHEKTYPLKGQQNPNHFNMNVEQVNDNIDGWKQSNAQYNQRTMQNKVIKNEQQPKIEQNQKNLVKLQHLQASSEPHQQIFKSPQSTKRHPFNKDDDELTTYDIIQTRSLDDIIPISNEISQSCDDEKDLSVIVQESQRFLSESQKDDSNHNNQKFVSSKKPERDLVQRFLSNKEKSSRMSNLQSGENRSERDAEEQSKKQQEVPAQEAYVPQKMEIER